MKSTKITSTFSSNRYAQNYEFLYIIFYTVDANLFDLYSFGIQLINEAQSYTTPRDTVRFHQNFKTLKIRNRVFVQLMYAFEKLYFFGMNIN